MAKITSVAALLGVVVLMAGCGQKGPLYLEGHEPRSQKNARPMISSKNSDNPEVEPSAPN